eukprot:scaffold672658_cov42-Prasinocladus_malaysianus.AAC.1
MLNQQLGGSKLGKEVKDEAVAGVAPGVKQHGRRLLHHPGDLPDPAPQRLGVAARVQGRLWQGAYVCLEDHRQCGGRADHGGGGLDARLAAQGGHEAVVAPAHGGVN